MLTYTTALKTHTDTVDCIILKSKSLFLCIYCGPSAEWSYLLIYFIQIMTFLHLSYKHATKLYLNFPYNEIMKIFENALCSEFFLKIIKNTLGLFVRFDRRYVNGIRYAYK